MAELPSLNVGAFSYLALSHGLAFFHAGCRNRWALRLASHSLLGTGRKKDDLQMHLYLCPTYHLLQSGSRMRGAADKTIH